MKRTVIEMKVSSIVVSVPLFGDSFFMKRTVIEMKVSSIVVSAPSFGDSFFIPRKNIVFPTSQLGVSVPSFGDSFFIKKPGQKVLSITGVFPSPHSGILFLSHRTAAQSAAEQYGFRPLIRGFFFYLNELTKGSYVFIEVSVPSFGDSFFIPVVMICRQV